MGSWTYVYILGYMMDENKTQMGLVVGLNMKTLGPNVMYGLGGSNGA